jgi:hypothetical protein
VISSGVGGTEDVDVEDILVERVVHSGVLNVRCGRWDCDRTLDLVSIELVSSVEGLTALAGELFLCRHHALFFLNSEA